MIKQIKAGLGFINRANKFMMSNEAQSEVTEPKKPYRMPKQKTLDVYTPDYPVRTRNFRTLLFLNTQRLWTPPLLQVPYASAFMGLIYLIRFNPWYLTFPASLPIMMGTQMFVFFSWISHKRHYKYIVERVYLYSGNMVEFTFSNKIRRRLKNIEGQVNFLNPEQLKTPSHGEDGTHLWSQKGTPFPEKLRYRQNPVTKQIQIEAPEKPLLYGWTKYPNNYTPYIFPKTYEYANWQILVPLFSGRYIDLSNGVNQIVELPKGEDYASAEQQLEWIKQDEAKNAQLKMKRLAEQQEGSKN